MSSMRLRIQFVLFSILLVVMLMLAHTISFTSLALSSSFIVNQTQDLNYSHTNKKDSIPKTTNITLIANDHVVITVAPDNPLHPGGIQYEAMAFNGTVPGPTMTFKEGEVVLMTLINNGELVHSLDLHGITGASQALSGPVIQGENKSWVFEVNASAPSVFMYHCDADNLNGIWEHVASGMYGSIVIKAAADEARNNEGIKEFNIVFSEIYNNADEGLFKGTNGVIGSFDLGKFLEDDPDLMLTNGMAYKYTPWIGTASRFSLNEDAELFQVQPGEITRWYIVNAGPRRSVNFNFAAATIDVIYPPTELHPITTPSPVISSSSLSSMDTIQNSLVNNYSSANQVSAELANKRYLISIPPGSGVIVETVFPEEGSYFGNDHDLASLLYGSGFVVSVKNNFTS